VQEALSNVVKHACATQVTVALSLDPAGLRMSIADNGAGTQ
jgi:two-component system sensor histidine kinase UhpB